MSWQDVVYAIGQWIFIIALVPSVLGKDKPALSTSLTTGLVLAVYVVTLISLNLWISAISSAVTAATWFILAYQKFKK
jgi:hypothetical protein